MIGLGLWLLLSDDIHEVEPQVIDAEPQSTARLPTDPAAPDLAQYADILQRPLFSPQRRPFVAPEPTPQPVAPPRVRLSAVSISNSVRVAVIQELDTNRTQYVREGDELGQWVVEKVDPNRVILRSNNQTITIPLFGGS